MGQAHEYAHLSPNAEPGKHDVASRTAYATQRPFAGAAAAGGRAWTRQLSAISPPGRSRRFSVLSATIRSSRRDVSGPENYGVSSVERPRDDVSNCVASHTARTKPRLLNQRDEIGVSEISLDVVECGKSPSMGTSQRASAVELVPQIDWDVHALGQPPRERFIHLSFAQRQEAETLAQPVIVGVITRSSGRRNPAHSVEFIVEPNVRTIAPAHGSGPRHSLVLDEHVRVIPVNVVNEIAPKTVLYVASVDVDHRDQRPRP